MKRKVHLSNGATTEWDDDVESLEELEKMLARIGVTIVTIEE